MSIIKGKTNTVAGVGKNGTGFTLFTPIWQDHLVNNASWLRADTFSWQSGAVYVAAYNHLATEVNEQYVQMYSFSNTAGHGCMALSPSPAVGDPLWGYSPLFNFGHVVAVSENSITYHDDTNGSEISVSRNTSGAVSAFKFYRDVVGASIVYYLRAADGHKIVLPDQENTVMAIYNATGIAWYYILDTTNQRFKLPRNKYGFTGFRDGVGNYVAPGLPNITSGKANILAYKQDGVSSYTEGSITANYDVHGGLINNSGNWMWSGIARLNANIENPIYGASDTVQPPAVQTYLYFFVGNTVEEVTTINVGQLTESLNGKADTSLGNVTEEGKGTAVEWIMPDYSRVVATGLADNPTSQSTDSYTCPTDGWINMHADRSAVGNTLFFRVNEVTRSLFPAFSATFANLMYPVNKGDIVNFRTDSTSATWVISYCNFIPCKGA